MGCGPSNSAVPVQGEGISTISKLVYPRPEAFEIPLMDDDPDSLIKKHPPKRLKRLEEQLGSTPSIEDLEEKLATAEIRRQQFLANRSQRTTYDKLSQDATDNDASTIPEEGEGDDQDQDDMPDDGESHSALNQESQDGERLDADHDDHERVELEPLAAQDEQDDAQEDEEEAADDREQEEGTYNRRRRSSDMSISNISNIKMKFKKYKKKNG